jgi:hypothetical protein
VVAVRDADVIAALGAVASALDRVRSAVGGSGYGRGA